ncbi:MAG: alpha/beta hydrolase [Rhodospirillales bacterium]
MLWRHYNDRAALDAQFSLDTARDLPAAMQRRLDLSAEARARVPNRLKVPYGPGREATLDLFLPPAGSGPAPVLLFIHGGFWKALDAATFSFVGGAYAPAGALVAVIDYPLIPSVRLGTIADAVMASIAWVARHAGEHGGDPARIHVSGHSAGGHLTALALDPARQAAAGIPAGAVKGGVAISGVFDLTPVPLSVLRDPLDFTADEVATLSPQKAVPSGAAPLVVAVGGAETQEFVDQSLDYARAWAGAGNPVDLHVVAQAHHVDILTTAFGKPGAPLHTAVLRQMGLG